MKLKDKRTGAETDCGWFFKGQPFRDKTTDRVVGYWLDFENGYSIFLSTQEMERLMKVEQ